MDLSLIPILSEMTSSQKDELIIKLINRITELEQKVRDLEQRLNKNSSNSHKPPSSDGLKKNRSLRTKSDNKSGAQKGHAAQTLEPCENPDLIVEHSIDVCPHCQANLENTIPIGFKRIQIFELPELNINVTEHRLLEKTCSACHTYCSASLPEGIKYGLQYGNRLKSFLIYLRDYHFLPSQRITEFFRDVFNHSISEGIIFTGEETIFNCLYPFEESVKNVLEAQKVLHADETSLRVESKNYWLHVLSTKDVTSYFVHTKRGRAAMDEMNILPNFKGTLCHDHWKPYFTYECVHALCNAHHLRELKAVFEGTKHPWSDQMGTLLKEMKMIKDQGLLTSSKLQAFEASYDEIIQNGYMQANKIDSMKTGPPLKKSFPKEICLLDRLKNYKAQVLMFMHNPDVPFDNNQAERDIRMMKVKIKISGCFRQKEYAQIFCRIRSYISTCKKKGFHILAALTQAFNGQPILA
jgi:transposase